MKITARIISAAAAAVMAVCSVSLNAFASEKPVGLGYQL